MLISLQIQALCIIRDSDNQQAPPQDDALYLILKNLQHCPQTVQALKSLLISKNYSVAPSMVANRGRLNTHQGSFSLFESVTGNNLSVGDFFFGHFTELQNNFITLDQEPGRRKLLIELLVWDNTKQVYNFYELMSIKNQQIWFYRGDSLDIIADNKYLYRDLPPQTPRYGERMRCSACHISGGPIMKELAFPHNDWWMADRALIFQPNKLSTELNTWLTNLNDARDFSAQVSQGIDKLEASKNYQDTRKLLTLKEQLRPLFCETEINLLSDTKLTQQTLLRIQIPTEFFVHQFFANNHYFYIDQQDYLLLLDKFNLNFPETTLKDADHAWLSPVKGYSDTRAIISLINNNIISSDFAHAVLALDFKQPLFSQQRCDLLKLVPEILDINWEQEFIANLKLSSFESSAELRRFLLLSNHEKHEYVLNINKKINDYLNYIQHNLNTYEGREYYFNMLITKRAQVYNSEISQNPLGQILEPGFRVIFPEPQ
jgi:hypothetical protein